MASLETKDYSEELNEKLARILLDNIKCVALLIQKDTREIIAANRFGLKAGVVIGKTCYESWRKQKVPCSWCMAPKLWQTGEEQHIEINDSGIIWDAYWVPITENLYLHYAFDITDKKEKELKLYELKEKYEHLYENAPLGYQSLDENGNILDVNTAWLDFFGYSKEEIIGKWFGDFLTQDSKELFKIRFEEFKRICSVDGVEYQIIKKNGEHADIAFYGRIGYNINGDIKQTHCIFQDITEQKQIEKKLKESEEHFKNIAEQSIMGIIIIQDDIIKYENQKAADIFEYTLEEIYNWNPNEYLKTIAPDYLPKVIEQTRKKQLGEKEVITHYTVRGITKSGKEIWVENYSKTIFYQGKPANLITIIDITEKKVAEQKIRDSEEKYRKLFESSPVGIGIADFEGNVYALNEVMTRITGHTLESYKNDSISSTYVNPHERANVLNLLKTTGEVKNREVLLKKKNGRIYNALLNISAIKMGEKDYILTNVQDITSIKEANKKFKESEQKFKNLAEESLIGISIVQDDVFKYVNQKLGEIYGYSIEEMLKWKPGELLKLIAPESLEFVSEQLRKKQAGDPDVVTHYNYQGVKKSGDIIWINNISRTINYEGRSADFVTQIDITDQIIAEQQLKKSEENYQVLADRYKMLLESITDGVYALNRDFIYTLVNKNAEKLVNMPVERLIGNKITEIFPGIEETLFFKTYERVMKNGEAERVSESFILPDGTKGDYTVSVYPTNEGIICIARNITEEKRIEQKLNEEREKAELYLNIAGVLLIVLDKNGTITLLNKKGYELLEYEEGELNGKNWFENCLPEDDKKRVFDYFTKLMNGEMEIIPHYVNKIVANSGKEKLIAWSSVLFYNEEGCITGILSAGEDITARAEAERNLMESEMRLRNLFETMEEGVILVDLEGKIIEANYAAEQILELKRSKIKERNYISPEWRTLRPDGSSMPYKEMAGPRAMKEKRPVKNMIMGLKRQDDTIVWLNMSASPLLDDNGKLLGIVATFSDFTEYKKAEQKIIEHSKNLEILNRIIVSGNKASNLSLLLNEILDFILKLMELDGGALYIVDDQNIFAEIVTYKDLPIEFIEHVKKVHINESPYQNVFINGVPVYTETIKKRHLDLIKKYEFNVIASVPLFSRNKIIGALNVVSKGRNEINENEKKLLKSIGREIGTLISKMQAEQLLIESEEKFRNLSDQSLMGIGILQDNKFKYINQAYADIFGFSVEEMMNWEIGDGIKSIHPDDRNFTSEQLEKKQKGDLDVVNHYNYRGIKKSGDIIWIDQYSKSILYEGRLADMITIIDITKRKKNEEKLKKSEKELSIRNKIQEIFLKYPDEEMYSEILNYVLKFFDSMYGTFGYMNENQDIIQAAITGEIWKECKMQNNNAIFSKEIWHQNIWGKIIQDKKAMYRNNPFKVPKGHIDIKTFLGAPIIHKNKIVGVIAVANKENGYTVDDLKQLELILEILAPIFYERLEKDKFEHLRRVVEEQLEASEEKLQNVINNIADVLIEINKNGIITFISPQIKDVTDYELDKVINNNISDLFHPEDISSIMDAIKSSKIINSDVHIDVKILHRQGYYLPVSIKGSTRKVNENIKFTGVLRDISERKNMEIMMEREVIQLKELEDLRNDLINRISHEFNTPLNLILSGSQLLSQDYNGEFLEDPLEIIDIINKGAYRLKDMVDNLLTAFKIESYELNMNIHDINISSIIKSSIGSIIPQANMRNIYITTELHKELKAKCDKNLIKKAIYNVISNAIKNTQPEGNVFIKTIEHRNYIDINIEDSGVGLTKKEKSKLFQKFGKIERYGRGMDVDIEGAGMGLYITNEIVKLHKGEILVDSKGRFKGSTFTIRLYKK